MTTIVALAALAAGQGLARPSAPDARELRRQREAAVAHAGPSVRALVESVGEPAVHAVLSCHPETGRRLGAAWPHPLGRLPRVRDFLLAVARPGHQDEVALFGLSRIDELSGPDPAAFEAYLADPLAYAMGIKSLQQGAAEWRAAKLQAQAADGRGQGWESPAVALGVAAAFFALGWLARSRRARREAT